jgi:hypothetical protein
MLAGCNDSGQRKAAREAQAAQRAAQEQQRKVSLAMGSSSLEATGRDREVDAGLRQAEKTLRDLLASQSGNWSAQAQLGEVLLTRATVRSVRVTVLLSAIRQDESYAAQALGYLKTHDLASRQWQGNRATCVAVRDALGDERAKLQEQIRDAGGKIVDCRASYDKLAEQARRLIHDATTQKEAGDALQAEADKMPVSTAQLARLADAYELQVSAARTLGESAIGEVQARALYDAEARQAAAADLASAGTAPDDPANPSKRTLALRAIPDETARLELAIIALRARLAAITVEQAACQQRLTVIDAQLGRGPTTSAPEDIKTLVASQQAATALSLGRVAAWSAALDAAVKDADAQFDQAIEQLRAAMAAARQAADFHEFDIRIRLADAYAGKGQMHVLLADAAGVFDEARKLAADPKLAGVMTADGSKPVSELVFGPYTTGGTAQDVNSQAGQRGAGVGLLQEAAWALDDGKAAAQAAEAAAGDQRIREGRLWTMVMSQMRVRYEGFAGTSIGQRGRTGAGGAGGMGGGPGPGPGPAPGGGGSNPVP